MWRNWTKSEALVAMLAAARLGAVHCVVFGGEFVGGTMYN